MRRLFLLVGLCLMATLVVAPAAMAQSSFIDPNAEVGAQCPEGLLPGGDPSTGLVCLTPEDQANRGSLTEADVPVVGVEDGICVGRGEGDPDCAAALLESLQQQNPAAEQYQSESPVAAETYSELPDTGGPSMLLLVGALLLGAGVLSASITVIRRR